MKVAVVTLTNLGLMLAMVAAIAGESVLFIGNSFTYGQGSAVRFYRNSTVTDLNHEGIGGVPALFKSFTDQAGLDYVSCSPYRVPIARLAAAQAVVMERSGAAEAKRTA